MLRNGATFRIVKKRLFLKLCLLATRPCLAGRSRTLLRYLATIYSATLLVWGAVVPWIRSAYSSGEFKLILNDIAYVGFEQDGMPQTLHSEVGP